MDREAREWSGIVVELERLLIGQAPTVTVAKGDRVTKALQDLHSGLSVPRLGELHVLVPEGVQGD